MRLAQIADALYVLGRCGRRIFCGLLYLPLAILHGIAVLLKDILHGVFRISRWIWRVLTQPVRLHRGEASRIYQEWVQVRGESNGVRFRRMSKRLLREFFGSNGLFFTMMRYLLPIGCCAFLVTLVSNAARADYGVSVFLNGEKVGCVENEAVCEQAEKIVRERLSHAEDETEVSLRRSLQIEPSDSAELYLTEYTLADKMLEQSGVSLTEAYGVYRGDEFLGAVADKQPVETALAVQLADYKATLGREVEAVFYTDEISYVSGSYLTDSLMSESKMIYNLTRATATTGVFHVVVSSNIYEIAERYSTTPEKIMELNPDLPNVLKIGMKIKVPTQERSLPISYTERKNTVSFIDYDTVEVETAELPLGQKKLIQHGEKGEKNNEIRATYVNGVLAATSLLHSTLVSAPISERVGVGTYAPAPASKTTVLRGTGEYSWPVNGGRISDVFISDRNHRGIDIAAPEGTEIYAAADGVVTVAKFNSSYGNYVMIDHGGGKQTLYAHATMLLVGTEMYVKRGQVIALVGTTGHSTGNHLHFEVRIDGVNYDPAGFLRVNAD